MTVNLSEIDRAIDNIEIEITESSLDVMKQAILTIDSALVLSTPVDTGRARANWLPSINSPETTKSDNLQIKTPETILNSENLILGDTFYISNNLEYIDKLNTGSSRQAPAGFVQLAAYSIFGI